MKKRIEAFGHAWSGIYWGIRREVHMKVHMTAFILVILGGIYLDLRAEEWIAAMICCTIVIAMELINTAIERICDLISLEKREEIKYIKDVAAGAVLVASIVSVFVALVIISQRITLIAVA